MSPLAAAAPRLRPVRYNRATDVQHIDDGRGDLEARSSRLAAALNQAGFVAEGGQIIDATTEVAQFS